MFSVETARIQQESALIDSKLEEHQRMSSELKRLQVNNSPSISVRCGDWVIILCCSWFIFCCSFVSSPLAERVRCCTAASVSPESAEGAFTGETREDGWLFWLGKRQKGADWAGAAAKESAVGGPGANAASPCRLGWPHNHLCQFRDLALLSTLL